MSGRIGTSERRLRRVLVASRGEAAIRVIQACRELGAVSVAVYRDDESHAPHVRLADEAIPLGASRDSYLSIDRMLEAARRARADAVHPGSGLLAESPDFARACTAKGLAFVGPSPEAMIAVGARTRARSLAVHVGIPVLADEPEIIRDDAHAVAVASRLGFPLSVLPRSGAGGRSLQIVRKADDLADAINRVRHEGRVYYGDDGVCVERHIAGRRRVDVDVLADMHGDALSLGQRECPVQYLHHRLIELSPARLSAQLSRSLDSAAVMLAKACGYTGAGTFEFLVNGEEYYFLGAVRCLQSGHAATEMVTRIDMVQAQLRIAGGERVWLEPGDVRSDGHSLLCRVLAEASQTNAVHDRGAFAVYCAPTGPGLRIDSAVYGRSDTESLQDSLIAQVCAWGQNSEMSRQRMIRALREFGIEGAHTTIPFLLRALRHPQIADGHLSSELVELVDVAEYGEHTNGRQPSALTDGFEDTAQKSGSAKAGGRRFKVSVEGQPYVVEVAELPPPGRSSHRSRAARPLVTRSDGVVTSPMRGTVVELAVSEGTFVKEGAVLCTIEAMKMENEVRAPRSGVVAGIEARPGDGVAAGATLMRVTTQG